MSLRILISSVRSTPHKGGHITYINNIIKDLIQQKKCSLCLWYSHRMRELARDPKGVISAFNGRVKIVKEGIPYAPYSVDSILLKPINIIIDRSVMKKLVNKYKIDIIHAVGPGLEMTISFPPPSHVDFLSRFGSSNPKFLQILSPWNFLNQNDMKKIHKVYTMLDSPLITPKAVFFKKSVDVLYKFEYVIVHLKESFRYMREIARSIGIDENAVVYIPFGIDLEKFDPNKYQTVNYLNKYELVRKEIRILYPARIAPEKNQLLVLQAIYILSRTFRNINFKLNLVGEIQDINYYQLLKNFINKTKLWKYINFVGSVEYDKMPKIYSMHDVVIISSKRELLSSSVLEAMAMKKPVICPRLPTIQLVFKDKKHCLMTDPSNPKELIDKLIFLIDNPKFTERLTINARSLIEEEFDLKKSMKKTINIYEKLV